MKYPWAIKRRCRPFIHLIEGQEAIMATLDNLTAALADLDADVTKIAADVLAALADLRAQIDVLVAGTITQAQIDALTESLNVVDAKVEELDAAVPDQPIA